MMDKIYINELLVRCIIGINQEERRDKQDILINIILHCNLKIAATNDNFKDAIDYRSIKQKIFSMAESSHFFLIESLAENVANICLKESGVTTAHVLVEKPSALRFAKSVGVEIIRERD